MKGEYDGESLMVESILLGGGFFILGGIILEGGRVHWFLGLVFFLVLWESSTDCEYHCRGHGVARGFGHGGQDSFRFPGARETDRLLLAGWEDSQFG